MQIFVEVFENNYTEFSFIQVGQNRKRFSGNVQTVPENEGAKKHELMENTTLLVQCGKTVRRKKKGCTTNICLFFQKTKKKFSLQNFGKFW